VSAGNPRPDHTPDERNSRTSHQRTQLTLIEGPDPWGPWRSEIPSFSSLNFFPKNDQFGCQDRLGTYYVFGNITAQREGVSFTQCVLSRRQLERTGAENASFAPCFYTKTIILPRQAQDKHRESTQNADAFALGRLDGWIYSGLPACVDWGWRGQ